MKNASMGLSLLNYILSNHSLRWLEKINYDRAGYNKAKRYSSRKKFKRNQRSGL